MYLETTLVCACTQNHGPPAGLSFVCPYFLPRFGEMTLGCSVLGRGAEPLVRTQFLEHPPTLNFGANHLKK